MTQAPNRRQRRLAMKYQGILKAKSKLPFHKWMEVTRENLQRGKELHAANTDAVEKKIAEQLESIEESKIIAWKEVGYNDKEIEMLREANAILSVRDKETWQTDKKVARKLMKDARESLNKRLND
jgi:trehalose/maltose hydrolase-like predicted phosphorylase